MPILENLDEFVLEIKENRSLIDSTARQGHRVKSFGKSYCPRCTKQRNFYLEPEVPNGLISNLTIAKSRNRYGNPFSGDSRPSLFSCRCVQCDLDIVVLIFEGAEGNMIYSFSRDHGGLSTPNTPPEIGHFLDQAYLSLTVKSHTAAVAMFRTALEELLRIQGYDLGTLSERIEALSNDKATGKGPPWVKEFNICFLDVLRKLANMAVHPKDVANLSAIDQEVVLGVEVTFLELLDLIYEQPARDQARVDAFNAITRKTS